MSMRGCPGCLSLTRSFWWRLQYHPDKNPDPKAAEYFATYIAKASLFYTASLLPAWLLGSGPALLAEVNNYGACGLLGLLVLVVIAAILSC